MSDAWRDLDAQSERVLALSDEDAAAEHLALYEGNQVLADKAIAMARARLEGLLAERARH